MSIDYDPFSSHHRKMGEYKMPSWRRVAAYGTIALSAIGIAVDSSYTVESRQALGRTEIMAVDSDAANKMYEDSAWIVLPGFKMSWNDSRNIAESVSPALSERGQVYAVGYSNEGFNIEEVYSSVIALAEANNIETLHLYGHSAGGLVSVELASLIDERRDDLTVSTIIYDHGPTGGDESIFDKRWLRGMATSDDMDLHIPTVARFAIEASQRLSDPGERTFGQIIEQTLNEVRPTAVSTKQMLSMANYMLNFDRSNFNKLSKETDIFLLSNIKDAMVDQRFVRSDLRDLAGENLKMIYAIDDTWPAHASPQYNSDEYCEILRLILDSYMPERKPNFDEKWFKRLVI